MRTLESFLDETTRETRETLAVESGFSAPDGGLVIEEVEMKGFMRYLRRTNPPITFPETFTVITGPTGAGKTSILDAVTFTLYKRSTRTDLRTIRISEIVQPGGFTRVGFQQGGARYDVRRGIDASGTSYLTVRRDGKSLRGTIPELEALLEDIVGLDYDGFRNSTFVRQEEMKEIGAEGPSKRLEVFQKLFRLETFEKAAAKAKERLDGVRVRIEGAEGESRALRDQVVKLPERREGAASLRGVVATQRAALQDAEGRLASLKEEFAKREGEHEAYLEARAKREEHQASLEDVERRMREKRSVRGGLRDLQEKTVALEREAEALRKQEDTIRALLERQRDFVVLSTEVRAARDRLRDAEADAGAVEEELGQKVAGAESRLAALSTEVGVEEAFGVLRQEGSLDERVRRIDQELAWLAGREELVERLEREQATSREALRAVRRKVEGINRDTFLFSEIQETIRALRAELGKKRAEARNHRKKLKTRVEELREKREAIGFDASAAERLEVLQEKVTHLPEVEETLHRARDELQKLGGVTGQLHEMGEQRRTLDEALQEDAKVLDRLQEAEARYQDLNTELETVRRDVDEATKVLLRSQGELKAAEERVVELEGLAARLQALEEGMEELRDRAEVYTVLKDGVFHRKGVVMHAVNRLLPELQIETTRNLDDLTDGRLRRVRLETHEEAGGYGIRILVEGVDGEWHDVGIFSGGERTQINAALRFAIAKELASMPQVGRTYGRMKTLFIDEGDLGSLDTERSRELFVAKLFKMGAFFDKVILITHLAEVAERFPGRVHVTMTPEGESRAEVVA
ncbi:MAG: AAA family ATPase [Thermoplasmata archaeon]